ncbi:putative aspartate aminotransferase, cytoplasmic 2 isoform X2 [Carassius carassius]|uniref:putative aspartate aminotransferase, cytoplasmic 2 isoform X2 n=1 Tax=Carassius carassius TaxID=217509 RepID=UPI0028696835|nr:putative aspartate aminotransferase, cytoplasmic 2 isoform X2 [Carassius carassius]
MHQHEMSARSVFDGAVFMPSQMKLLEDFKRDTHPDKVNLAGREYVGEHGHTTWLPLVRKIKQQIATDPTLTPEYPPNLGIPEFTRRATELALGKDSPAIVESRVFGVQTVGCTGAVRLGAELLRSCYCSSSSWSGPILLSSPCDDSLAGIFKAAGIEDVQYYRFWDAESNGVCVENMVRDLENAPEQCLVVLFASGHRPTGAELSHEDWKRVAEKRQLFPFFLMSAQGLCSGSLEQDAWPVRHCVSLGLELLCAQSFSYSFGLYGERVGHLLCVLKQNLLAVQSQAEKIVQTLWSCPPMEGARVVATVLSNPAHLVDWQESVKAIAERCMLIRERLRERLRLLGGPWQWDHIIKPGGLYCCFGLNTQQVEFLVQKKHIYLLPNGCLNVSAINSRNLDYVAESIHQALSSKL